jgi:hypothetical protein
MKHTRDSHSLNADDAEAMAFRAVAFIASDESYLADFLSRSGLGPQDLAELIEDRAFLTGVLDHLLADEPLLLAFCGNASIDPSDVQPARNALSSS